MEFIMNFVNMINKIVDAIKNLVKMIRDINDGKTDDVEEPEAEG